MLKIQDEVANVIIEHITLEDLIVEGSYYPILVQGDHCTFRNCTFRNCFADAFKVDDSRTSGGWQSTDGKIINCDMYHFGENGIDITGGDYWQVWHTSVHHGIANRSFNEQASGTKCNGIMIKNNSIGTIVDGCRIFNIHAKFGAISLGGTSYYSAPEEVPALGLKFRNNIIHDITSPYIAGFIGAKNCEFTNNIIYNCDTMYSSSGVLYGRETLIWLSDGRNIHTDPITHYSCSGNIIENNIFYGNVSTYNYKEDEVNSTGNVDPSANNDDNLTLNYNIVSSSRNSYFDDESLTHSNMVSNKGYDTNSQTSPPIFTNYGENLIRLTQDSVGIDQGGSVADNIYDYNDIRRSLGGVPDIGPYENEFHVYSNGETLTGWATSTNATTPTLVTDTTIQSGVLSFATIGTGWLKDASNQSWDNDEQFVISWYSKADKKHTFIVRLKTTAGDFIKMIFESDRTISDFSDTSKPRFPLGNGLASTQDDNWHRYEFDIEKNLKEALPTAEINFIERFYVKNTNSNDVRVDDIRLQSAHGSIGDWRFNEAQGGKVEDVSGKGRHGTLTDMPTENPRTSSWIAGGGTGWRSKALQFGANSDSSVEINNLSTSFARGLTFSAWVKYKNNTDEYKAIASGLTGDGVYPRIFQRKGRIHYQMRMDNGQSVDVQTKISSPIAIGEWTHIAAVTNMATGKATLYINGVERGEKAFSKSSIDTGNTSMLLGNDSSNSSTSHAFSGGP